MKKFLLILSYLASLGLWNVASAAPVIEVTLLGTGVPLTNAAALNAAGRALSGLMVKAGTEKMLFDCGQGIFTRLIQSGGSMMTPNVGVDKVFLSHLHSDHIGDLGALYAVGALYRKVDATGSDPSTLPLRVWGPEGGPNQPVATWALMQNFRIAYETDFFVRLLFTGPGDATITPESVETINSTTELFEGVVYSNDGVTVTAFLVDHKPVEPAYGFRVDYLGHS
ncbi:MAG: MBL fold metallo-hydrolase, partial [Methylococcales bacterium]